MFQWVRKKDEKEGRVSLRKRNKIKNVSNNISEEIGVLDELSANEELINQ